MATSMEIQHVCLANGTEDLRYSVTLECTGYPDRRYVARFEGHWLGESTTEENAWQKARTYAKGRG